MLTIKQVNSFVYLGGTLCENGGSSKEIQRKVQANAAAWKRVEGIMWDRKLKKQLKGKVLETCEVPACIYGLGTLALTERQEEKIQIAENNWVRRICKITQKDRRKMKELREEIGVKKTPNDESSTKQNEMGRAHAKNGRRQTVKKSMESRRGWQKKKNKAAMERLCQVRS